MNATNANAFPTRPAAATGHEGRLTLLAVILAASILSTALHYTHNYIEMEHYPAPSLISNDVIRVGIVVGWPLLTAAGALGVWLYAQGHYGRAAVAIAVASLAGLVTPLHFTSGNPHIPALWYATIFTDAIAGFALLGFAYWTFIDRASRGDASRHA